MSFFSKAIDSTGTPAERGALRRGRPGLWLTTALVAGAFGGFQAHARQALPRGRQVLLGGTAAVMALMLTLPTEAQLRWDTDPAAGVQGGTGDWDDVTDNWTDDLGVTNTTWVDGSSAQFETMAGTVTVVGDRSVDSIIVLIDGYDIVGPGRLVIVGAPSVFDIFVGTTLTLGAEVTGAADLEKAGGGTLILSGANTYTGTTTITAGTLVLANAGGTLVDTNAVVVSAGGTLRLNFDETLGSIAGAGTIDLQANTLTIGGGATTTFSGGITGAGGLAITGGDTTLTGANDYAGGTTVSGGALTVSGAGTLGAAGSTTTLSGGTLTIENAQDATVLQSGGALAGGGSVVNLGQTGGTGTLDALRRATAIGGTVTAVGPDGIAAANTGAGTVEIETTGAGTVNNGAGAGISATAEAGTVTVTANADATGTTAGIQASTGAGNILVEGSGAVAGGTRGIEASSQAGGISIGGSGTTATSGANSITIDARITDAAATSDVQINRSGAITNTGGGVSTGILANNAGTGNISVTGTGPITLDAASLGTGISAMNTNAGGGDIAISTAGAINGGQTGIRATNTGTGSTAIAVGAAIGDVTAPDLFGVISQHSGSGAQEVSTSAAVRTTGLSAIEVTTTGSGDVTVNAGAALEAGVNGTGIFTTGAGGVVSITANGPIDAGLVGISAANSGAGNITVIQNGAIGATTAPTTAGIETIVQTGTAAITAGAAITTGPTGVGIRTDTGTGTTGITVTGAGTVGGGSAAIESVTAGGGATTVENSGTVQATGAANALGFGASGAGSFTFDNLAGGVGLGMMASAAGSGAVTLNNQAGAVWTTNAGGTSVMAGGNDAFNNAGTFNVSAASSLTGWEAIANTGVLNLGAGSTFGGAGTTITNNGGAINVAGTAALTGNLNNAGGVVSLGGGGATGVLNLSGDLAGGGGTLNLDVDLSVADAGTADRLNVGGVASGPLVVNLTSVGGLAGQANPIVLLEAAGGLGGLNVTANATNFTLGGGLISYNVGIDGNQLQLFGAPSPIIGGVSANAAIVQGLVGSIVNRPSGAFVSGLQVDTPNNCAVGGWGRLTGGTARATAFTRSGAFNTPARLNASFTGVQGGFDYGCYEDFIDGWDLVGGITFGTNLGESRQDIFNVDLMGNPVGNPISTTQATFEQTYAGAYFAFFRQNLGGDLQLRRDSTKFVFNNNVGTDLIDVAYSTRATTLSGSMSYYHQLGDGLSLVPAAGFSISRSRGGRLTFSDMDASTLDVHPHTSKLVFGGATLASTTIGETGDNATTRFVTATVYSDVSGPRRSTFTPGGGMPPMPVELSTGNLGTFGELSIGLGHVQVLEAQTARAAKQLDASIRADARFSDRVQAFGLTAQVRFKF